MTRTEGETRARDVPLGELREWPRNPRRISKPRLEQLKRALVAEPEMLAARPLIALPDGTVIAGNQRLRAARELGWASLPVVTVDLDDGRAAEWALRDNRGYGEDDEQAVGALLAELGADGRELDLTGYGSAEIDALLAAVRPAPATDPDDAPPVPADPRSVRGEVYELGPHRVMCGDATSEADVAALLAGERPVLCLTDPPYGVSYDPKWRQEAAEQGRLSFRASRVGEVRNDDRADWREAWELAPSDVIYAWSPPGSTRTRHQAALEHAGFEIRIEVIWVKPHLPIGRGHYHVRHEPCFYAVRKDAKSHWIGDRKQTTVWDISLDLNVAGGHSTQKPVECSTRALINHEGDVYDPFAGTGSSLIAAEMRGRRWWGMELEPGYVDVIRQRYADFTGRPELAP